MYFAVEMPTIESGGEFALANEKLKAQMQSSLCRQWEVADELNMNESTLSRMLRHELNPAMKEKIEAAIQTVSKRREVEHDAQTTI